MLGGTLILVPDHLSVFPMKLAEYVRTKRVTVWNSVSSVLTLLANKGCLGNQPFEDLRLVIFSGEVLPVKSLVKFKKHMEQAIFCNIYGQTEANSSTGYIVEKIPKDQNWKFPIGKPLPNFEVFLLDENGAEVRGPGREGEIYVKSSSVALGYFKNGELTDTKFRADPRMPSPAPKVYRTGDIAVYDDNRDLIFLGRKDNMVKVRGHRVELGEIERCLYSHDDVHLAAAVAVPDDRFTNRIVSFVSLKDGGAVGRDALLSLCTETLPHYMVPENIGFLDNFPLTPNKKIDRKALSERAAELLNVNL